MTPLSWKIFRAANWIQFLYSLAGLLFVIANLAKNGFPGISTFILFPLGLFIMMCNNYFNLYFLKNHFPDKQVGQYLRSTKTILFILCIPFSLLLVVLIIIGSSEEFSKEHIHEYEGKLLLAGFFFVLIHWLYILFKQVKMSNLIKEESHNSLAKSISEIGSE